MKTLYFQRKYCQEATLYDIIKDPMGPFFMNITAYTIEDCFYCEQLYELISRTNMQSNTNFIKVGSDLSRNQFKEMYPDARGFPHVIIDDESVGGLVETATVFLKKGLITSKKNG